MTQTGYEPLRRFEYGWVLAGLVWGMVVGVAAATVPTLLVLLASGESLEPDGAWTVPLLWLALFTIMGLSQGAMAGTIVGVVVMLAVGRDPERRAARRIAATLALLVTPLLLWAVWRFL